MVGPVWGLDDEGQLQGVWRRTGQPHLWIGLGMRGWLPVDRWTNVS